MKMLLGHPTSSILVLAVGAAPILLGTQATHAALVSLGTLNVTGDGNTGWVRTGSAGSGANDGSPDGQSYWGAGTATHTGTSDSNPLIAGSYTVDFLNAYTAGVFPVSHSVQAFSWDGTTEAAIGAPTVFPLPPGFRDWQPASYTFAISPGASVIGQDLRLKFNGSGTGQFWGFDSVVVNVEPIPEPSRALLLSLGGIGMLLRRRR